MLFRAATLALLIGVFAAPAQAAGPITLMPGVTYERAVQFTPHGAIALHVITAPRPGDQSGLYALAPVLASSTILGGREKVTQLERDVSGQATVAGINGDLFSAVDWHPERRGDRRRRAAAPAACGLARRSASTLPAPCTSTGSSSPGPGRARASGARSTASTRRRPPGRSCSSRPPTAGRRPRDRERGRGDPLRRFRQPRPTPTSARPLRPSATGGGDAIPPDGAVLMATGVGGREAAGRGAGRHAAHGCG